MLLWIAGEFKNRVYDVSNTGTEVLRFLSLARYNIKKQELHCEYGGIMAQQQSGGERIVGIDLYNSVLHADGGTQIYENLAEFKKFSEALRGAGHKIYLMWINRDKSTVDEVIKKLENKGFFKSSDDGGLGFAKDDLVFSDSVDDCLKQMSSLNLTHFVDLKPGDDQFPDQIQPLFFSRGESQDTAYPCFSSWRDIREYFRWSHGIDSHSSARLTKIKTLKGFGDNRVYKLYMEDGRHFVLKHYMEQDEGESARMLNEIRHLKALQDVGFDNVPRTFWHDDRWAIYSFAEGEPLEDISSEDVDQFITWLLKLDQKGPELRGQDIQNAPGARVRLGQYVEDLNKKWNQVLSSCQKPDGPKDVMLFMLTDMEQMRQDNINHFYLWCKRKGWDKDDILPEEDRIFSPGDFGFHNALKTSDGELNFVDFEESGWDDPAKLMADFFFNIEQDLSMKDKLRVLEAFVKNRGDDEKFLERFWAVADMVAVEWILNVLSIVIPEEMERARYLDPDIDPKKLIHERFKLAIKLREEFQPMEHLCKHDQLLDGEGDI